MLKLTMMKGLPGSGKSTYAKSQLENDAMTKRVNMDDLREMMNNAKWNGTFERAVQSIREDIICDLLDRGYSVIVDDTNLHPKHEEKMRRVAERFDAQFEIVDLTYVPVSECVENDLKRNRSVGESVIRQMYEKFIKGKNFVRRDDRLAECIIVDLDGTLAIHNGRGPFDYEKIHSDIVNPLVRNVVWGFLNHDYDIVICSGREWSKNTDRLTKEWLKRNDIEYNEIYMRAPGDYRKDYVVKREFLEEIVKNRNPILAIDDRQQVVDMWRDAGIECWQVAEGNF